MGILKGIAVAVGVGLAVGFGKRNATRPVRQPARTLNPILSRIEDIETRVAHVESTPLPAPPDPEEIRALGTLVSIQGQDIADLRQEIRQIETNSSRQAEAFSRKVAAIEQLVPANIEASVNAHMAELEQRLRGEFHEIHNRTVDAFTSAIESRVVGRIAALESSLAGQSESIAALREKSLKTDDHLQRLLEAVEKLCTRAESQARIAVEVQSSPAAVNGYHPAVLPTPIPAPVPVPASFPEPAPFPKSAPSSKSAPAPEPAPSPEPAPFPKSAPAPKPAPFPEPAPSPEPEPELVLAGSRTPTAVEHRRPRSLAMALLGLAVIGFRLIR